MRHFRQTIIIPDRISNSIFNLPCVIGVMKHNNLPVYQLTDNVTSLYGFQMLKARPGDILAEDYTGDWWTMTPKEYQSYLQHNH